MRGIHGENTKYVIMNWEGVDSVMIFGEEIAHRDVAQAMPGRLVSAGFLYIIRAPNGYGEYAEYPRVVCYGRSVSLNVDSRPVEDERIITLSLDLRQE